MASVTAGLISRETSLVSPTHSNQECRFKRLVRFLKKCGLEKDPFLTKFSISQNNTIMLLLRTRSDVINMAKQLIIPYSQELLKPPSVMWQRLPGRTSGGIQHGIPTKKDSVRFPHSYVDTNKETQTTDIVLASL